MVGYAMRSYPDFYGIHCHALSANMVDECQADAFFDRFELYI